MKTALLQTLTPPPNKMIDHDDEPRNTIDINRTVGVIILRPQYNLQGGYLFDCPLTQKHLRRSYWNPVNMTEDIIQRYNNFNTKGFPEDLIFVYFNNQPTPSIYSDLINDYDYDVTPIDSALADNKWVEDSVVSDD